LGSGQNPVIHIGKRKTSMEDMKANPAQTIKIFARKFFIMRKLKYDD
jgi:hypothetical protein